MKLNLNDLKSLLSTGQVAVSLTGATCIHCGLVMPTVDAAGAHDAECPKHPIVAERDTLRAELAAERARAEKAEAELNAHVGKQALKEMLRQMLRNAEQKDALTAQVADLRAALEVYANEKSWGLTGDNAKQCAWFHGGGLLPAQKTDGWVAARAALDRTPAQSLNRVKAEALREAAKTFDGCHENHGHLLMAMAERLAKEAGYATT